MHDENDDVTDCEADVNAYLKSGSPLELPARMPRVFLDFGLDNFVQSIITIIAYSVIQSDGGWRPTQH